MPGGVRGTPCTRPPMTPLHTPTLRSARPPQRLWWMEGGTTLPVYVDISTKGEQLAQTNPDANLGTGAGDPQGYRSETRVAGGGAAPAHE